MLLITLDTTRADRLGPYGYARAQTPAYDRLAQEGVLWTRAYASCPLTIPSHATILTGRAPPSHGVRDNGDFVLGAEQVLLSERLQAQGYRTGAFTSAFPTQARWGFDQGFDVYHDPLARLPTQLDWRDERPADMVVDDAMATMADWEGSTFAWVHLFDAHWPYAPPPAYSQAHPGRPYDGEIAFVSDQVGRLLDWWDQAHPRSLVVLTSDHGEGFGEGGERTHGYLLHDGTIRVPLILRGRGLAGAGLPAGTQRTEVVAHADIVPTVLSILGLPLDPSLQGKDLRQGGSGQAYSEAMTGQFNLGLAPLFARTDPTGRTTEGAWTGFYPAAGDQVGVDPAHPNPGLEGQATALGALRATLDEVLAPEAALDAAALQQLMALGYVGGDLGAEAGTVDPRDVIDLIPLTWSVRQAMGAGQLAAAESQLAQLEAGMPDTYGVDLLRAQLLRVQGRHDQARQRFAALYERSPSSTVALQLASLRALQAQWPEAEGWYAKALDHQPASPEAMAGLVHSALQQGEPELARERAERFLAIYPDHAELALIRAQMLLLDGRADEAAAEALGALGRLPRTPWALGVAALALWEQGKADPSLDLLHEALRLDPYDLSIRMRLTECLLEVGRHAEAVRTIAPAARLLPQDPTIAALHERAKTALAEERSR